MDGSPGMNSSKANSLKPVYSTSSFLQRPRIEGIILGRGSGGHLRFEGFRDAVEGPKLCFREVAGDAVGACKPVIPRGIDPTMRAKVSGLAGSFGIQLSGCARRMCSQIERYAKFPTHFFLHCDPSLLRSGHTTSPPCIEALLPAVTAVTGRLE
jgi:hypothetical protein